MKRTFRNCAIIAGLIERRFPGKEKSQRQMTISTDLVYDVLRKHQPDHMLLRAAAAEAATGQLDIRRVGQMLSRVRGRIVHKALERVSPLAVPVLLEIGREHVPGEEADEFLAEVAAESGERGDAVTFTGGTDSGGCQRARTLRLGAADCVADVAGVLYWPEQALLVVSDLHLEKGSPLRARLAGAALRHRRHAGAARERRSRRYAPRVVVSLGDNFHDGGGAARLCRR